ncbi:MAG: glutamate-1-semialdehyde 2,1-aminomutase [Planctomycetes bacterium]|nr:glutamate-1-semialdehyde 2,1-aminomutase [Planctomycetota bacterium]
MKAADGGQGGRKGRIVRSRKRSEAAFVRARASLVGGVNSPVRAFRGVGGTPVFLASGKGCRVTDVDGNTYIDYLASWGPLILGHAPAAVVAAIRRRAGLGTTFGAPTPEESELAELVRKAFPSIEKLRFVSSGTEATMSALRVARGFTGRDLVVKFEGGYHGHSDGLLVKAGSGATTLGVPDSAGVPAAFAERTATLPFNDVAALDAFFGERGSEVAAVIVEPLPANMGVVPPRAGYLERLRELTKQHGALLVLDEVITGFRVAFGGAQELWKIRPDLTCLGKIIGGGLPVGAYGGRADVMAKVAPEGPVYQAGTLSGNPVAMAAGLATLRQLRSKAVYRRLEKLAARLEAGLAAAAHEGGVPVRIHRVGSVMTLFFRDGGEVVDYASALCSDRDRYARFFHAMLERGVYLPPSQFEAFFVSTAHDEKAIDQTIAAAKEAMRVAAG